MLKMLGSKAHDFTKKRTADVCIETNETFESLMLSNDVLNSLISKGFKRPSPIQLKAIPLGKLGFDLFVQSKSGTGKTLVFSIISLESLKENTNLEVLILTPTRDIAVQIENVIQDIGSDVKNLKVASFIGGLPIQEDFSKLKDCKIAVGAPGRLKSLIEMQKLDTSHIKLLILDEADKLIEASFMEDLNYIASKLPKHKQVIASSASYFESSKELLKTFMKNPIEVSANTDIPLLLGLKQFVSIVDYNPLITKLLQLKLDETIKILQSVPFKQCIVFTNYQIRAESLCNTLNRLGWPCKYITANQKQLQRLKILKELKNNKIRLLISTDLLSRGIDAENVNMIINYDIPYSAATYLHRIGRAGRFGGHGLCINLCVDGKEYENFCNLINYISKSTALYKIPKKDDMNDAEKNILDLWNQDFEKIELSEILDSTKDLEMPLKFTNGDVKNNNFKDDFKENKNLLNGFSENSIENQNNGNSGDSLNIDSNSKKMSSSCQLNNEISEDNLKNATEILVTETQFDEDFNKTFNLNKNEKLFEISEDGLNLNEPYPCSRLNVGRYSFDQAKNKLYLIKDDNFMSSNKYQFLKNNLARLEISKMLLNFKNDDRNEFFSFEVIASFLEEQSSNNNEQSLVRLKLFIESNDSRKESKINEKVLKSVNHSLEEYKNQASKFCEIQQRICKKYQNRTCSEMIQNLLDNKVNEQNDKQNLENLENFGKPYLKQNSKKLKKSKNKLSKDTSKNENFPKWVLIKPTEYDSINKKSKPINSIEREMKQKLNLKNEPRNLLNQNIGEIRNSIQINTECFQSPNIHQWMNMWMNQINHVQMFSKNYSKLKESI